jgi:hypothetical protein
VRLERSYGPARPIGDFLGRPFAPTRGPHVPVAAAELLVPGLAARRRSAHEEQKRNCSKPTEPPIGAVSVHSPRRRSSRVSTASRTATAIVGSCALSAPSRRTGGTSPRRVAAPRNAQRRELCEHLQTKSPSAVAAERPGRGALARAGAWVQAKGGGADASLKAGRSA